MRQSGDMVRAVCQPKHKMSDGNHLIIPKSSLQFNSKRKFMILFNFVELVLGAREGKFPDEKNFKVKYETI